MPSPHGGASGALTIAPPRTRPFLDVCDLTVSFSTDDGVVRAVEGLTFSVERGKTLGIVGESGSGKSVTTTGIMGLQRGKGARFSGEVWLDGEEVLHATPQRLRELRGERMAMIFQDPLSAMHPYYTVGEQIAEAYRVHRSVSRKAARGRAVEMLDRVGIPQPRTRVDDYPHQFSGGMRQRAMIAMALCCDPALLIADEPTTALDVTVQAQILDLMRDLQQEFDSAIVVITHDLGVVAEIADEVLVMYAGRGIERAATRTLFHQPEHPYTFGLLGSMTRLDRDRSDRLMPIAGSPPSLIDLPAGCAFAPRCPYDELAGPRTHEEQPPMTETAPGHQVACWLPRAQRQQIWREEIVTRL